MPKSTYTVKEVANLLGFSTNTVYKYLEDGTIKAVRLGEEGRFRIPANEVERLLQERRKNLPGGANAEPPSIPAIAVEIKDSPSVFDWFVGFLSMAIGFTQLVNPSYVFTEESLAGFVPYINIISAFLIVGGALLLGFDVFKVRRDHKHKILNLVMGGMYLVLGGIFLSQEVLFSIGYFSVAIILITSSLWKMGYYTRYLIFVNLLIVLGGLAIAIWPSAFTSCSLCFAGFPRAVFLPIWLVAVCIFSYLSFRAVKRNRSFIIATAVLVGFFSLVYSIMSFINGYWGRSVFGIVLGTFSFIFPFADTFDSFKSKTRRESVVSFLWLLGVFFVGSVVLQTVNHSFQNIILAEMERRADIAASISKNFMDAKASVLSGFLSDDELALLVAGGQPSKALDEKLKQIYLASNNSFSRVVITDKKGVIIDTYPFYLPSQNVDISERNYYTMPAATGHVFVTDMVTPKSPGVVPQLLISFPILDSKDNFMGIILAGIDTSELQHRLETIGSNDSSSFAVLDKNGNYILNPGPQTTIVKAPDDSIAIKAITGNADKEVAYSHDGILKFAAYRRVDTYGWGVIATQPLSTALKMYSLMGFAAFLFFIMATIGSLSLVMFLRKNK